MIRDFNNGYDVQLCECVDVWMGHTSILIIDYRFSTRNMFCKRHQSINHKTDSLKFDLFNKRSSKILKHYKNLNIQQTTTRIHKRIVYNIKREHQEEEE